MAKEPTREEIDKAMFMNLVMMLSTSAIQQMGKIENPLTGKMEVDLEGAQATIDLIEVLERKAKGNLDKDEQAFLKQTLAALQMNFVSAAGEGGAKAEPAAEQGKQAPSTAAPDPQPSASAPGATGSKHEPKFHKSYE